MEFSAMFEQATGYVSSKLNQVDSHHRIEKAPIGSTWKLVNWLVVYLPLWKIWVRQLGWLFLIYGENKKLFQTTNQLKLVETSDFHPESTIHKRGPQDRYVGVQRGQVEFSGYDMLS